MRWRKGGEYWVESECGYRVSKSYIGDQVRYTAWAPRKAPDGPPIMLCTHPDRVAAVAACDKHKNSL